MIKIDISDTSKDLTEGSMKGIVLIEVYWYIFTKKNNSVLICGFFVYLDAVQQIDGCL